MSLKSLLFISLFVLILSVSAVSAADLNVTDSSISIDDSLVSSDVDKVTQKMSEVPGTFGDLQKEINNAPSGSVLNLTRDYNGADNLKIQLNKNLTIDGRGHTINCLEKENCRAFYSSSGNITIKNLKIINGRNDDDYNGSAIHIEESAQYTLENCTLNNNWADDYGGAIYNGGNKPLRIINCQFNNNEADDDSGGAIYSLGEVFVENSIFKSNLAYVSGGAIYSTKKIHANNCSFDSNNAEGSSLYRCGGGAICTRGDAIIDNCTFYTNYAEDYGGAIYACDNVNVKGCLFDSNKVSCALSQCYGGAISAKNDVSVYNSTFSNNYAGDYGGAIRADNVYINDLLDDCSSSFFIKNSVGNYDGGAVYADSNVFANNTVFDGNTAKSRGGAIYALENVNVGGCLFDSNNADGSKYISCYGGAIRAKDDVSVYNSTFSNNYAGDYGGAIYADNVYINQKSGDFSSFFTKNSAGDDKGGAVYADSNVYAYNVVFDGNTAKVDGGAIYACDNVNVKACLFDSNKAVGAKSASCYGGAFRAEDDVVITNCTFRNNYAENKGGAVYADTTTLNGVNLFESNTARDYGGAIYTKKFNQDVKDTVFINNKAESEDGGAIYIYKENWITFSQCVFENNCCGDEGGAIYLDSKSSHLTLKENIFTVNKADEGQSVYNCGKYDEIINNFWGGKNPSSENDQLIEWKFFGSNVHHSDANPLNMHHTQIAK